MIRFSALMCLILSAALTASGCGRDEHPAEHPSVATSGTKLEGDFTDSGSGTLIKADTLSAVDRRLQDVTSLAARITYTSTSGINDSHAQVTGAVFVPKGNPPEEGWPMIAFGHPPTGILPECAPSLSPTLLDSVTTVAALVSAGYVVTVSDYQGLGSNEIYHPYLDSTTVGYRRFTTTSQASRYR